MSVVLPEPISPVITTKPSVNQMVDSMYALARACCLLRYRNCGSGLNRNGNSRSLNSSRYMQLLTHLVRRFDSRECESRGQIRQAAAARAARSALHHLLPQLNDRACDPVAVSCH